MAITINDIDRTFRGLAELTLTRLSDGRVLNFPKPQSMGVSNGTVSRRIPTRNSAGFGSFGNAFPTGFDYQMSLSYANIQPEILAFRLGNNFATVTKDLFMTKAIDVYSNNIPATTTGKVGFTITIDEVSQASYTNVNVSVALIQSDFALFDPTVDDQFAVGAAGAFKFSNNLVASLARVTVKVPYTVTGLGISNEVIGKHRVDATLITTENEVVFLDIPSVTPNLDGGGFMPMEEGIEMPFYINEVAGLDRPYNVTYTGESI